MFAILFVCLLGSFAYAEPAARRTRQAAGACGQTPYSKNVVSFSADGTPLKRIVGGVEANPHSIPWQVSLRYQSGQHSCGGSLVRTSDKNESDIVITASHCIEGYDYGSRRYYRLSETELYVVFGAHLQSEEATGEKTRNIFYFITHPDYEYKSPGTPYATTNNDIAILKLDSPVQFSDTIQPICLPAAGEILPDNTQGIVSGWGDLWSGQKTGSDELRQVLLPIVNSEVCKQNNSQYFTINPQTMICAGTPNKDSCQGDSGGPYFFKKPQGFVLHGVVSFGAGCAAPNLPGVYTRVSNYIEWIQKTISAWSFYSGK